MFRKGVILFFVGLFFSCHEEEANLPPVAAFDFVDGTDRIILDGTASSDADTKSLFYHWTSSDNSIKFESVTAAETYFKIPAGSEEKSLDISLTVTDGKSQSVKTESVTVPKFSTVRSYGLGKVLTKEVSNNVSYNWYFDQANTGAHSLSNCGPASVTMMTKWFEQSFTGTPEDARNTYRPEGGWWFTNDIINYLNKFSVNNYVIALDNIHNLKGEIDKGNIAILCLDMYYVEYLDDPDYHFNKFYGTGATGWGHFIVIKGYKEVDGITFYECYDPYSYTNKYPEGELKGKDRYYASADLDKATDLWWDYAVVVHKEDTPGGRRKVDVGSIVHKAGR